jgi:hypothetical protein
MCHFELAAEELNVEGDWLVDTYQENLPENIEYILSWVVTKLCVSLELSQS